MTEREREDLARLLGRLRDAGRGVILVDHDIELADARLRSPGLPRRRRRRGAGPPAEVRADPACARASSACRRTRLSA
jgi:branched-chain amino acid transport system permease protein